MTSRRGVGISLTLAMAAAVAALFGAPELTATLR
jgi:hypothetical protein